MLSHPRLSLREKILACGFAVLQLGSPASAQVNSITLDRNELSFSRTTLDFGPAGLMTFSRGKIWFFGGSFDFRTTAFKFPKSLVVFPVGPERLETPSTIELVLPSDAVFNSAKGEINPEAETELNQVAETIRYNARCPVMIQAFTDAAGPDGGDRLLPGRGWLETIRDYIGDRLGTDSSNKRLSERVARSVKLWLETHEGLAPATLRSVGFGSRDSVSPNRHPDGSDDPDGRKSNRRVKFIIPKLPGYSGDCA